MMHLFRLFRIAPIAPVLRHLVISCALSGPTIVFGAKDSKE